MADRILAEAQRDPGVRFLITVSWLSKRDRRVALWANPEVCARHAALGRRLAELDPADRHKLFTRFPPEAVAFLRGQPAEARRLMLGLGADLWDDTAAKAAFDLDALWGEAAAKAAFDLALIDIPGLDLDVDPPGLDMGPDPEDA